MSDCIFCKIAAGDIPAERLYEDGDVLAFPDVHPNAPVHILVIPKKHYATTLDLADEAPEVYGSMMKAAAAVARDQGIAGDGFRLILNTNDHGGQEVYHVHMHILGGEPIGKLRTKPKKKG